MWGQDISRDEIQNKYVHLVGGWCVTRSDNYHDPLTLSMTSKITRERIGVHPLLMHVHPPFLYMYTPPNTVSLRGCATNSQPYQRVNPSTKKVAPGAILLTTNELTYDYTHHIHHIHHIALMDL